MAELEGMYRSADCGFLASAAAPRPHLECYLPGHPGGAQAILTKIPPGQRAGLGRREPTTWEVREQLQTLGEVEWGDKGGQFFTGSDPSSGQQEPEPGTVYLGKSYFLLFGPQGTRL